MRAVYPKQPPSYATHANPDVSDSIALLELCRPLNVNVFAVGEGNPRGGQGEIGCPPVFPCEVV